MKLTTEEVAAKYRRHVVTVRLALSDQALHGEQRVRGGHWLIEEECAAAWARGEKCEHHAEVVHLRRGRNAA